MPPSLTPFSRWFLVEFAERNRTNDQSRGGAADREGLYAERWDAVADGDTLPVLAARAGRTHGEVVADRLDHREHLRSVADQVALAQRIGDLAVLDQVRL